MEQDKMRRHIYHSLFQKNDAKTWYYFIILTSYVTIEGD